VRLLDLFCGGGGAARGYAEAGFEVVGVDSEPQPEYPFEFVLADWTKALFGLGTGFDAIHASPPCQASSALTKGTNAGRVYPQWIPQVREALDAVGLPYVIENVQGSQLRRDLTLCGEMFGLDVIRHRYFELGGWTAPVPVHRPHRGRVRGWRHGAYFDGPYVAVYGEGGGKGPVSEWQTAMGIDWITDRKTMAEAIPPAYTRYVGSHLAAHLTGQRVA
jgi:hypothetical protein